jgi:hypothetical protein
MYYTNEAYSDMAEQRHILAAYAAMSEKSGVNSVSTKASAEIGFRKKYWVNPVINSTVGVWMGESKRIYWSDHVIVVEKHNKLWLFTPGCGAQCVLLPSVDRESILEELSEIK